VKLCLCAVSQIFS